MEMQEIKVGWYVRTKDYGIQKITAIDEFAMEDGVLYFATETNPNYLDFSYEDVIGEPSPNIIDLIEVGDYVNGKKVIFVCYTEQGSSGKFVETEDGYWFETDIKTIVTKECFERCEYKI